MITESFATVVGFCPLDFIGLFVYGAVVLLGIGVDDVSYFVSNEIMVASWTVVDFFNVSFSLDVRGSTVESIVVALINCLLLVVFGIFDILVLISSVLGSLVMISVVIGLPVVTSVVVRLRVVTSVVVVVVAFTVVMAFAVTFFVVISLVVGSWVTGFRLAVVIGLTS